MTAWRLEVEHANTTGATKLFQSYAERYPELYPDDGFEDWLGLLKSSSVTLETRDTLGITDFGRDILLYLTRIRLFEKWAVVDG